MHLCYILPPIEFYSPQLGGAIATFAMQQGRRMEAKGHKISIVAPHESEEIYEVGEFYALKEVTRNSIPPLKRAFSTRIVRKILKYDWLYYERYLSEAKRALKAASPDVVICFNDWQLPREVRRTLPEARIFLRLSNECRTSASDVSELVRTPEKIFTVSNYIRDWTIKEFDVQREKFLALPNGADLSSFFPEDNYVSRIMDMNRPLKALFISRLDPNKGPDLALKSVSILRREGIKVELTIVGSKWFGQNDDKDPYIEELKKLAVDADAKLAGYVARPKIPQTIRQFDLLMFPIRNNDPMSQVIFESMASGLAVISCQLGGTLEAVGDAAVWAQPDNAESLADRLREFHNQRSLLLDYKNRSIARAQIMTWDANADRFEAVLKEKPL